MVILSIDPGTSESAWVLYDSVARTVLAHAKERNDDVRASLYALSQRDLDAVVIERFASYGKPVGQECLDTCVFIGRLYEAVPEDIPALLIFRKDVKMHLCGATAGVNDAVIRQRLIDLWGGKEKAIGNKKNPGPLYGLKADAWQSLALAVCASESAPKTPEDQSRVA